MPHYNATTSRTAAARCHVGFRDLVANTVKHPMIETAEDDQL
jgi:hypothetical protein